MWVCLHIYTRTHMHILIYVREKVFCCVRPHHFYIQPHMSAKVTPVFFLTRGQISNPQPQSYLLYMIVNSSSQLPEKESDRERKRSILYQECVLSLLCNRLSVSLDLCTSRGPRLG